MSNPAENWPALMSAAQNGDKAAYKRLLSEISTPLFRYISRRIFDKSQCEDLLQDILLAIHTARHTYRVTQPFDRWMYGIARHKTIDFIRKTSRHSKNELSSDALVETFSVPETNNPDSETKDLLTKALEKLPVKHRSVIVMTKIEGLSIAETAKKTGMSEVAVKVTAHRAIKKLKMILVENEV